MYYVYLSPENADALCHAIEQARTRLKAVETGKNWLPMKYSARLSWEVLYEAREMLRLSLQSAAERDRPFSRSRIDFPQESIGLLTQSIEQVMDDLHQIEMSQNLSLMRSLAKGCGQALEECCLAENLNRKSILLEF